MRFAISIPQHVPDGAFDTAKLRDYLIRAESLGFHSAWTQEAVLGPAPILAPLELMTFAAACTQRLRLGCAVFEVDPASLVARFTEGLQLMKACLTEPRITFSGRFWKLEGAVVEPKPLQKPYPPLWIGGHHPAAVRRALRQRLLWCR